MNIEKVKFLYIQYTEILQIVTNADRQDEYAHNLRIALSTDDVIIMKAFCKYCEDTGIRLLIRSVN